MVITAAANLSAFVQLMRDPLQRYRVYLDTTDEEMRKYGMGHGNWAKLMSTREALIREIVALQLERFDRETTQ